MVKLSEIFGSIFGSPSERVGPNDLPRNIEEDLMREFGSHRGDEQINMPFGGWWEFHSQDRSHSGEMGSSLFEEMDQMFHEFFRGIESKFIEFESLAPQFPPMVGFPDSRQDADEHDNNQCQSGSLRDRMLNKDSKEWGSNKSYKDEDINSQTREKTPFHGPLSSLFGDFWRHPFQQGPSIEGQIRADKDLDHELEQGKQSLNDILTQQEDDRHVTLEKPHYSSSFSYSSSFTLGSDGIAESKTTRKDFDGNEEITVTRRMGDQKYTVTHRIDSSGNEETQEDFVNIDKDKVAEFEENFSLSRKRGSKGPSLPLSPDNGSSQYDPKPFSSLYDSILDRFFRR